MMQVLVIDVWVDEVNELQSLRIERNWYRLDLNTWSRGVSWSTQRKEFMIHTPLRSQRSVPPFLAKRLIVFRLSGVQSCRNTSAVRLR